MILRNAIPHCPLQVLEYAVKYKKLELMNKAALRSIGFKMDKGWRYLSHDVFGTWVQILHFN